MGKRHRAYLHAPGLFALTCVFALAPGAIAQSRDALAPRMPIGADDGAHSGLFSDRGGERAGPAIQGSGVTRGESEESLLFSQPPLLDDIGIGPRFLLAIASSCQFGASAAEDFTLESSTELTRVEWEGVYFGAAFDWPLPPQSVRLTIYHDDGAGNAGEVVADFPGIAIEFARHERAPIFGFHPVYTFSASLPERVRIEAGERYWVGVNINAAGIFGPAFGWLASPHGNAAETPQPDQPLQNRAISCAQLPDVDFIPGSDLALDADLSLRLYGGCVNDCDCDGVSDSEEIAGGTAADCNGNGVPDACELASGAAIDCDGDGAIDACQLRASVAMDSGVMGPVRTGDALLHDLGEPAPARSSVEIVVRALGDLDSDTEFLAAHLNGVFLGDLFVTGAGECEREADETTLTISAEIFNRAVNGGPAALTLTPSNGVLSFGCGDTFATTSVRYEARHPEDCNGNGVPDACDILSGASNDCDGDFVPDECQISDGLTHRSGAMRAVGFEDPVIFEIGGPSPASGPVSVTVTAIGDFSHTPEYLSVVLNGTVLGRLFETDGADCSIAPLRGELVIQPEQFNALIASGAAVFELRGSETVDASLCGGDTFSAMTVRYNGVGMGDCNGNGIFDGCELAQGAAGDRNGNGVIDACEFYGDLNRDGQRNSADVAILLSRWRTDDKDADLNGDGIVDTQDLSVLLTLFGT